VRVSSGAISLKQSSLQVSPWARAFEGAFSIERISTWPGSIQPTSLTRGAVLILGRFTPERKAVLDGIREELRRREWVPILFDFDKPTQRDFTETILTLAGMARFVIADISNPKSSPLELQATVPNYMIPFVPILQIGEEPFEMFKDLKHKYNDWVLDPLKYDSIENLLLVFEPAILAPALEKHAELTARKARELVTRDVRSYLPQNRKP
jgi:hypothetical protein